MYHKGNSEERDIRIWASRIGDEGVRDPEVQGSGRLRFVAAEARRTIRDPQTSLKSQADLVNAEPHRG